MGVTFYFIVIVFKLLQSHPACKGPEFLKAAFNLNGRSPLVAHFLRMRNLTSDINLVVRIQHTEIENLPPYPFDDFVSRTKSFIIHCCYANPCWHQRPGYTIYSLL